MFLQVMFRAKVGEKYKLRPEIDLEEMYGAVSCSPMQFETFNTIVSILVYKNQ